VYSLKNWVVVTRGGSRTPFEAKAKDSEKVQGQGPSCRGQVASRPRTKRFKDTFENTRKYKYKHCNYDFTGHSSVKLYKNRIDLSCLQVCFSQNPKLQYCACYILHNIIAYYIVYYLLQYTVLKTNIFAVSDVAKREKWGYTSLGAGSGGLSTNFALP